MVSSIMKFSVLAALCAAANAIAIVPRQAIPSRDQIAALAPDLGALPNTNPNAFGDCDGPAQANGQIPRVPCQCPPTRDVYIASMIADIEAGHAVNNTGVKMTFPTGDTVQDKHGRITAAIITLQNLNGPGKGCPGVSTTLGIQSNNLDKCGDFFCGDAPASSSSSSSADAAVTTTSADAATTTSADAAATSAPPAAQPAPSQAPVNVAEASTVTVTSIQVVTSIITVTAGETPAATDPAVTNSAATNTQAAAAPPASSTSDSAPAATTSAAAGNGQITRDLVDQLAPQLGSQPNNNPNASGDCDGPVLQDGSVKKVPCACPPTRPDFIDALFADIVAGHATNSPSAKITFPTGNSKADQHARITAATVALQNLNGPGKGCPFVSTTFGAQSDAIGN